jgi:hypothetical protein
VVLRTVVGVPSFRGQWENEALRKCFFGTGLGLVKDQLWKAIAKAGIKKTMGG